MKTLLRMMKNDKNAYSIGRVCAVLSFLLFASVSIYLAIKAKDNWAGYTVFATCCMGYIVVQLANKSVDVMGFKVQEKKEDKENDK